MNAFLLLATLSLVVGGLVLLLGALILRENPRQKLNVVVACMLFFGGVGSVLGGLGFLTARAEGVTEDSVLSADFFQNVAYLWEFFFPTLLYFAAIFPTERPFIKRLGGFAFLLFVPHLFHLILLVTIGWLAPDLSFPQLTGPALASASLNIFGLISKLFLSIHQALFSLVNLAYGGAAAFLLIASYRAARVRRVRMQLQVIGVGLTACLVLYTAATSLPTLLNIEIADWLRSMLTTAALVIGSGSITWAIVRHKFLDTKLLAREAILYAVASAALVGFYLVVIAQVSRFFTRISGVEAKVLEPVLLIIALILFGPVVSRLEQALGAFFLRDPSDYRNVLKQLGRELLTTIDLDLLLARSIKTVADALLARSAYIVAFSREGAFIHRGAGEVIDADTVELLAPIVSELPADLEFVRVAEPHRAIGPKARDLLLERFDATILIPLRSKGETVGALLLGPKITGTEYTSEDASLLLTLAGQLGVSLQNGLLLRDRVAVARYEEELNLARQIQRSFLPSSFPKLPRLDVHATTIPSKEVGGDLYDFVPVGDDRFLVAIADVSGKGVPAALLSSMLQASLRTQAGNVASVADICSNMNGLVFRSTTPEQFATFFLAAVDQGELRLSFCNAGHNYPLLLRRDGATATLERGGLILGIMDGVRFQEDAVVLATGDRVIFYTDGVSEALNEEDEEFGEERLLDLVRSFPAEWTAREVTEAILEELYGFLGDREAQDDVTLMVLQVLEPEEAPLHETPALVAHGEREETPDLSPA